MSDLFRDTVFGHVVRHITNRRFFQFAEEKNPALWKQYLDRQQTKNMALYGHPDDATSEEKQDCERLPGTESQSHMNGNGANLSEESSQTRTGDGEHQLSSTITGQKIDPEKGRDITIVTWFGDNDPEVRALKDSMNNDSGTKQTDAYELVDVQKGLCDL